MQPELVKFGATVAVGAGFVCCLLVLVWLCLGRLPADILPRLFARKADEQGEGDRKQLGFVAGMLLLVGSLGCGILAEAISDDITDDEAWVHSVLVIRPTDWKIKVETLFEVGEGAPAEGARAFSMVSAGDKGPVFWGKPKQLARELAATGLFSRFGGETGCRVEEVVSASESPGSACMQIGAGDTAEGALDRAVRPVYHTAKAEVFRTGKYEEELRGITERIVFCRSACLVCFVLSVLTLVMGGISVIGRLRPERKAWSQIRELGGLFLLFVFGYLLCLYGYRSEELEFNKRVFGYFLHLSRYGDSCRPAPGACSMVPEGISGMALMSVEGAPSPQYLVVHDAKTGSGAPRLSVLTLQETMPPTLETVSVSCWGDGGPASDLEGICRAWYDDPTRYLALESGYYEGRDGRLYLIRVERGTAGWSGTVEKALILPRSLRVGGKAGEKTVVPAFEGIAVARGGGKPMLLLAHRGAGEEPACIWAAPLEEALRGSAPLEEVLEFVTEFWAEALGRDPIVRHCTDMWVDGAQRLWVGACKDTGDSGPFVSAVFSLDRRASDKESVGEAVSPARAAESSLWLSGFKVEAIASPRKRGELALIGTDDELYGGTVRPLGQP